MSQLAYFSLHYHTYQWTTQGHQANHLHSITPWCDTWTLHDTCPETLWLSCGPLHMTQASGLDLSRLRSTSERLLALVCTPWHIWHNVSSHTATYDTQQTTRHPPWPPCWCTMLRDLHHDHLLPADAADTSRSTVMTPSSSVDRHPRPMK